MVEFSFIQKGSNQMQWENLLPKNTAEKFDIKNDIFKVEKSSVDDNKLVLTINRQPIDEWFKEQWEKLRKSLRQSAEEPRKNRGFRM